MVIEKKICTFAFIHQTLHLLTKVYKMYKVYSLHLMLFPSPVLHLRKKILSECKVCWVKAKVLQVNLSWPTFHYWLYPEWLCMWQIINLEPKYKVCLVLWAHAEFLRVSTMFLGSAKILWANAEFLGKFPREMLIFHWRMQSLSGECKGFVREHKECLCSSQKFGSEWKVCWEMHVSQVKA